MKRATLKENKTGMGTAWKEKLWKLGGSGGMLPHIFFPQKIKICAIWGYPEVIFYVNMTTDIMLIYTKNA